MEVTTDDKSFNVVVEAAATTLSTSANASPPAAAFSVRILRQAPYAVFLEEPFELEIAVVENNGAVGETNATTNSQFFDVLISLVDDFEVDGNIRSNTSTPSASNAAKSSLLLMHDPSPLALGEPGVVQCSVTMELTRRNVFAHNQAYRIKLMIVRASSTETHDRATPCRREVVASAMSNQILVVTHKLEVSPSAEWSNVWYKDEGGRDKCMEIMAGVYDRHRGLLYESIPLLLTLCYAPSRGYQRFVPPIPVTNQEILRILGPKSNNRISIDKTTGTIKIRFRVEDVSKNHQGQDFCLQISVHDNREGSQTIIAPGLTPPITIRSKRNKRGRSMSSSAVVSTVASTLSSALSITDASSLPNQLTHTDRHGESMSPQTGSPDEHYYAQFAEAVRGISQWVDEVVTGLYPLQWHIVGYAQDDSRNADYNRPHHNMINHNSLITRVLKTYNESTRDQVHFLQQLLNSNMSLPIGPNHPIRTSSSDNANLPHLQYGMMPHPPHPTFFPTAQQHLPYRVLQPPLPYYSYPHRYATPQLPTVKTENEQFPPMDDATNKSSHRRVHYPARQFATECHGRALDHDDYSFRKPNAAPIVAHSHQNSSENEVEFVLARQFKSIRTGDRLGFPAYTSLKVLLGFYRRSSNDRSVCVANVFVPLNPEDFGPSEMHEATTILNQAEPAAVQSLRSCGSIHDMLNRALVYEWSQSITSESSQKRDSTGKYNVSF